MSDEKKKDKAAPAAPAAPETQGAPVARPADPAEELSLENGLLKERLLALEAENAALKTIGAKAQADDSNGVKRPFSKVHMFGSGHREIFAGDALHESELKGLEEGSDFEFR